MKCEYCGGPDGIDCGNLRFQCKSCTIKAKNITRKVFICIHCDGIYADEPVSQCDCMEGTGHDFVEGVLTYVI